MAFLAESKWETTEEGLRGDSLERPASFWTQADALLRKNLVYQRRRTATNFILIFFPFILCTILLVFQTFVDINLRNPSNRCGCACVDTNGDGKCEKVCGLQYSNLAQARTCPIPSPQEWPALLQVPAPNYRAVKTHDVSFSDFPKESCRHTGSCPVTVLVTAENQVLGKGLAGNIFSSSKSIDSASLFLHFEGLTLGSPSLPTISAQLDPAFLKDSRAYYLLNRCGPNNTISFNYKLSGVEFHKAVECVQVLTLWRNSTTEVNEVLYKGYKKGNPENKINEVLGAFDYSNSNEKGFNVSIWYNSSFKDNVGRPFNFLRVPRSVNLASNAYLRHMRGPGAEMGIDFVKDFPKPESVLVMDYSSFLGPLFFTWILLLLFPMMLSELVHEKSQKLRIMMKMHGLGDRAYWLISYAYFLSISISYVLVLMVFGSVVIGLKFIKLNDIGIQFVFYFLNINLQISSAFLGAIFFSDVKSVSVFGYLIIFSTGLLGHTFFQLFIEDASIPRFWIILMELYPGFSLYRGLYEFEQYSVMGDTMGSHGMLWQNLWDDDNGLRVVLVIMLIESFVLFGAAYYAEQVTYRANKKCLLMLKTYWKKCMFIRRNLSLRRKDSSKVFVDVERYDVKQEKDKVDQLLLEPRIAHAVVCNDLRMVYPRRDGNQRKVAVRGLSIALPRGECFGMLGPNGAGKTSFINMMIGLAKPSSGLAYVDGINILTDMDRVYPSMGVCPQFDLLWDSLTGREHLLFYGRLKNLKGLVLNQAVEESLRSVNLLNGGLADKQSKTYSGGMKRRLSVAISLIGNPKVVYMDEPSTGLDPASRSSLWNVVRSAKKDRAIILTTHSMEEAEALCDRIGIFVDGSFHCIGRPKELKARYGGSYILTVTTSDEHETAVTNMVTRLSPDAERIYHTPGTQRFEMPKHQVRISDVFHAVEVAKTRFPVFAWGLSDTTLEDVFVKVASGSPSP